MTTNTKALEVLTDDQAMSAFGGGQSTARKGGYLSDNPLPYGSDMWAVWREGFDYEARQALAERGRG